MAKTVYKYPLPMIDEVHVDMPRGARVLKVGVQNGEPFVWALVDTEAPMSPLRFSIRGTGHDCSAVLSMKYLDTIMLANDMLVFHVFMGACDG